MITSNITHFKKLYSLFILAGLLLSFTTFLVPQKASAQAFVPVKDAELNAAFKLFLTSAVGSAGGGTYMVNGNPVEITAEVCKTRIEPVVADKQSMFKSVDLDGDGSFDKLTEQGIYKYDWEETSPGVWELTPRIHRAEIDMRRSNPWRTTSGPGMGDIGPEDPSTEEIRDPITGAITRKGYYTNPANPYFFLPNPDELTAAEVNNSISLNCLLQEMVEWQKLQINMQMHSMVKEYFTDAQTYMLSQQLLTTLAAATIEWSNNELKQTFYIDGVATTTKGAIYRDYNSLASNIAAGRVDEIYGGTVSGNDLGIANPTDPDFVDRVGKALVSSSQPKDEKAQFADLKKRVEYSPHSGGNSAEDDYLYALRNSALNVTGIIQSETAQKMTQAAEKQKSRWETYGGYLSVLDCGADPFCRDPTIKTPGNILGKNLSNATDVGSDALKVADELGEGTGTSSQELSYQLQQRSLRDYDIQQLLTNQQTPQELFNEFEQVLVGYYGLGTSTTYWSRNMLVNTWDDIMWGSGAPWNAEALGRRLDEIIVEVEKYGTP